MGRVYEHLSRGIESEFDHTDDDELLMYDESDENIQELAEYYETTFKTKYPAEEFHGKRTDLQRLLSNETSI